MNIPVRVAVILCVLGMLVRPALAEAAAGAPSGDQAPAARSDAKTPTQWPQAVAVVGGCIGAAICTIGGGYAISRIGGKCIEAIARQPEAAGSMFAPMIVSAAMVEGGMLFAIVVCLIGVLK
jgi:F-type H+-transporting ATPase subunit c